MAEVMVAPKIDASMHLTPPQSSPQQKLPLQPLPQEDSPQSIDDSHDPMIKPASSNVARTGLSLHPNSSRRPPRKSTLTQQQKNQKRQRATQDQLMTLEVEFNKNPTPTAQVRERIAQDINMTERSVQIWFQNRRAKIKNIAKRSIENGDDCDSIPENMRQYIVNGPYGPVGKGFAAGMFARSGATLGPPGGPGMHLGADLSNGRTQIQHFQCRSLSIGTWRRVTQCSMDLVVFYAPDKACVTYYINNDSAGYKIEYPFAWIKNISLDHGDMIAAAEGASKRPGGLIIELNHPPKFYMDSSGLGGFYECGDFTEDRQASSVLVHELNGPSKILSGQLAKMISLDSYQNRFNTFTISPPPVRPASQPNHLLHPRHPQHPPHAAPVFPSGQPMSLMGPPAPRGHKRQRSRSVPAAIDVSMLRGPMPSFLIQHEGHPMPTISQNPNIFAPVPQHQPHPAFAPAPVGLTVDTAPGHHMAAPFAVPMSATTVNTPSDFGTPGFFAPGPPPPHLEQMNGSQFTTPFNNGFLNVDPAVMIGTSNTPLSITSHGDPVIADHSPPMHGISRAQSTDIFGTPGDFTHFGDETYHLHETFDKQMQLPFRSPMPGDTFQSPMTDAAFAFQSPTPMHGQDGPMGMPMGGQPRSMSFDCGSTPQEGSIAYNSPVGMANMPQSQHDSAVSFSTPTHLSREQTVAFQESKMFSSPGQLHHLVDEQSLFHQSPLGNGIMTTNDLDLETMGLFVDPQHLGTQQ